MISLLTAVTFLVLGTVAPPGGFARRIRPTPFTEKKTLPVRLAAHPVSGTLGKWRGPDLRETEEWVQGADPAINALMDREHTFIQLYGGVQRLLGRRVVEDADHRYTVVRLSDRLLTFADLEDQPVDMTVKAEELIDFAARLKKERKIPLLYVQAPSKNDVLPLPQGLTTAEDLQADSLLEALQEAKVDVLDLRPLFREAEDGESLFYATDHHWTPKGAFLGYQALARRLEKRYGFTYEEELTDPENFRVYTFEDIFLGSQGRRVGSLYGGTDDLEIWVPDFATNFSYTCPADGIEREGAFVTALLFPERLASSGLYETNPYTVYSGGDYLLTRAENRNPPNRKRVLVLRDSFGCGLTPFLSLVCQETDTIDPRGFQGGQETMLDYVDWLDPDVVIVLNTASSLENDTLFPYLPTARREAVKRSLAESTNSQQP